jgi:hypothetical protein
MKGFMSGDVLDGIKADSKPKSLTDGREVIPVEEG